MKMWSYTAGGLKIKVQQQYIKLHFGTKINVGALMINMIKVVLK